MSIKIWGIDVSKYNYPIDWTKVKKAGVKFAIIRCGYAPTNNRTNLQKDPYFESFYKGAKAAGIPLGVYFYSRCNSVATGKKEAEFIIKLIKDKKFEYPIWLDVEDKNTTSSTSKSELTAAVKACLNKLSEAGYYAGIYSGKYILRDELNDSELSKFDHWIAQYARSCSYTGRYTMWQFGAETNFLTKKNISGIGSDVADQNYCYVDYPSIIKSKGLNGYSKEDINYVYNQIPFYIETISKVNIRKEASTNSEIIYKAPKDVKYEISKISSNGKWGYVNFRKGWISLNKKYVKEYDK